MSTRNNDQSVKHRLKNIARATDKDYNFVCIQYMQERFLARLEKSFYRDNYILKGALLLLAYQIPLVRPSKDIDFLGRKTSNNTDAISSTIKQIAKIDLQDGVFFKQNALDVEQITEDAEYGGLRFKIPAIVGGDYQRLQLDIGFGDIMVDAPVDIQYPSLLEFPPPNIKVYPIESSFAEKFEAIVSLGLFGSRMKDFFDIWFLIQHHDINTERLQRAILKTFYNRNTPVTDSNYIFKNEFKNNYDKQKQWQAFLNRYGIQIEHTFEFVVSDIEKFIKPIIE